MVEYELHSIEVDLSGSLEFFHDVHRELREVALLRKDGDAYEKEHGERGDDILIDLDLENGLTHFTTIINLKHAIDEHKPNQECNQTDHILAVLSLFLRLFTFFAFELVETLLITEHVVDELRKAVTAREGCHQVLYKMKYSKSCDNSS